MTRGRKLVVILVFVGVVAASATLVVSNLRSREYGTLKTFIIPSDATVLLGDKKIKVNRSIGVTPGTYSLSVSRSGFASTKKNVTITKKATSEVNIILDVTSDEGRDWLGDHPEEIAEADGYYSRAFDATVEKARKRLPLINQLPFIDLQYRVDFGRSKENPNDADASAIYITYWSEEGKAKALDWLRLKGYDPADLEIVYKPGTRAF